jgi:hypothetical protein
MHWPKQSSTQDIFAFYNDFIDNIRLRSIFLGGADDMKSAHMVDCFIQSCQHSSYLTQVSRFDRKDSAKAHLFAPGNIAITLTNYLANWNSPVKQPIPPRPFTPPRHFGNANKAPVINPYQRHHIKQLLTDANSEHTIHESTLTADEYNQLTEVVINEVWTHDAVPDVPICVFCKTETHRFKECPLMNDSAFLRSFAICMCTTMTKELRSAIYRIDNPSAAVICQIITKSTAGKHKTNLSDFQQGKD